MKTLKLVPLFLIAFLFCNYTVIAQEEEEEEEIIEEVEENGEDEVSMITGVFKGMEDGTYVFSFKDEDGEENTINFDKIAPEVKKAFNLEKKEMIGKTFIVTYSNINEEEEDEDGEIEYTSVKTILTLKKL